MEGVLLPQVSNDVKDNVNKLEAVSKSDESHSQSEIAQPLKREQDSLDDFEHLDHDISPGPQVGTEKKDIVELSEPEFAPRATADHLAAINNTLSSSDAPGKFADEFSAVFTETKAPVAPSIPISNLLDSSLIEEDNRPVMGDTKLNQVQDDFLSGLINPPPVPPHGVTSDLYGGISATTQDFMDIERDLLRNMTPSPISAAKISMAHLAEKFSDSEPEGDDFKMPADLPKEPEEDHFSDFPAKEDLFKPFETKTAEVFKDVLSNDNYEDVFSKAEAKKPIELNEPKLKPKAEPPAPPKPVKEQSFVVEKQFEDPEPVKKIEDPVCLKPVIKNLSPEKEVMPVEAIFCQMGLDAWFNPERLNPKVEALIYWRDPKKSGAVFGGVLAVLLALSCFSLISVLAYLSLIALAGTICFRVYKNVLQAVQKTSDGHPFKDLLEQDLTLPQEKVQQVSGVAVAHLNAAVSELRRLFLVEDLVDSLKFGVLLWCLTYLGAWFNGMTLIIIAFVALFTLPKVYETNKTQIDANLDVVRSKLQEITSKTRQINGSWINIVVLFFQYIIGAVTRNNLLVKAAVPIGKKAESEKDK